MLEVRYHQYRAYFNQRTEANKAIMAFLAGSQIARHTLTLTTGSDLLLPEVFPNVPHISRFNLKTALAMDVLAEAEAHLGAMAVPYIYAIHEDFVKTGVLRLMARAGSIPYAIANDARSQGMHEAVEGNIKGCFTPASLEVFHLLRRMRNSLIHAGGKASTELANHSQQPTTDATVLWHDLTGNAYPKLNAGQVVTLGHPEVVVALAVTKRLAREANQGLVKTLPRPLWADILVEDATSQYPNVGNANQARRLLNGLARHDYGTLGLASSEIVSAAKRANLSI